ncbi:hypothetical protein OR1_02995 [Geobacter sp. OR-1]|uniref:hypothetical protein n=1 Tax=Geobacter sp. OR-1 TaxID=1266765 RepID=UPI000543E105|nr:hypothetical protein [Geobacter sp. OR-1]GAM10702.1 hypothetical protein OR1_02995 [Geobacter sp. OR-1]
MQIEKSAFDIASLDDEIRVDGLCKGLLMAFYEALLAEGLDQAAATRLANGADHFIRDFVIGVKQRNIFDERPGLVRQFAGNWYIVNTLEPAVAYLADSLPGVARFYRYLADNGLVSAGFCSRVEAECCALEYYGSRIEGFWGITGDGYFDWDNECPMKEPEHA